MSGPSYAWLNAGRRMHFHHGPIDLIIQIDGTPEQAKRSFHRAWQRFQTVMIELVDELPALRILCPRDGIRVDGAIAQRMEAAVRPLAVHKVTSMAAVAGAVADEILAAITSGQSIKRAFVNNGGDIAFALDKGQAYEVAMVGRPDRPTILGTICIKAEDSVGGVATSSRHGRSLSLGIADSVTVLANSAANADAAATLIANAVDLPGHPAVQRQPASDLWPDTDLGDRLVTVDVSPLSDDEKATALDRGADFAKNFVSRCWIEAALLYLGGQSRTVGILPGWTAAETNLDQFGSLRSGQKTSKEVHVARG